MARKARKIDLALSNCVTSSETQGRSVGPREKARRKISSMGGRAPGYWLSPDHFQTVKRMLAPDWAQKMLCIIVPSRRTASPVFFSWVRTQRLLTRSRLIWLMHQRNARSQETFSSTDINSPFQNTVYPKTKDAFHSCIDHAFVNIREFEMPRQLTATKTSHEKWIRIFSVSIVIIQTCLLCQMQANSSGAEFL